MAPWRWSARGRSCRRCRTSRAPSALLLLRRGEAVGVDVLADDLWGGQPPPPRSRRSRSTSRSCASSSATRVACRRAGAATACSPRARSTRGSFELLRTGYASAQRWCARRRRPTVLTEAPALWRGPALADFTYEPWAQPEIARLDDLRLAALEERIDADLEVGRHATLVGELIGLVERNPDRERLLGQLMLALYRSGRQTEALDLYRQQRRRLDEELGLEPSPALRELEAAMLRQDPSLGRTATTGGRGRARAGPWRLPEPCCSRLLPSERPPCSARRTSPPPPRP